jgi:hypothetical protein
MVNGILEPQMFVGEKANQKASEATANLLFNSVLSLTQE